MSEEDVTHTAKGHGYKHRSQYPLTAAMVDGKPVTQHVEGGSEKPALASENSDDHHPLARKKSHKVDLISNTNAKLANPLGDLTDEEVMENAAAFAAANNLPVEAFRKGGVLAKRPHAFEKLAILDEEDKARLRFEVEHPYRSQTWQLYNMVIACSVAAAVQGMDESVISGAQLFFPSQFGIGEPNISPQYANNHEWIMGITNGAPYLACAVVGCWLTDPLNNYLGRRGAIAVTALISFVTCIWAGCTNTWWHLFIARFCLGIGIGPKSATVPIFAAECVPARIRGSLVMQWQLLGYAADLMFYHVSDKPHITGLNWRLMIASAGIPALVVMAQLPFLPESPRWLMKKGRYEKAFRSMMRLRGNEVMAARDLYYIFVLLEEEAAIVRGRNRFLEIFTIGRNRRAMIGSTIVMFGQQFCGVNAIVYYTATIFSSAGFSEIEALLASWGFGMLNAIFAIPGMLTIDRFGRRALLLFTFPIMAVLLLFTGFCFWIPEGSPARIGLITLGIYLYCIAYSPGEGPVPFTYSAEVYPLYIRELGMSLATATLWLFNFIVSFTFPRLLTAFKPQGAFAWYAGWCFLLSILILFFLPESKGYTLEELDQVFSVPTGVHAKYQLYNLKWHFKHYILRSKEPHEALYKFDDDSADDKEFFEPRKDGQIQHVA
ncbi:hypothetical protein B9479_002593 [Cryptococcus floricola]|uniref:Major facilitator superfamily (MFS) profile domain-containing protein n=1 Tax=Cryptococcus floricola TaxID=2591691 RepID=A0A5D3B3D9_9TREE|nr:hypothetical protein B9479_002593 [Cryptococcus floricola]